MTGLDLATETLEIFISMLLEGLPPEGSFPPDDEGHLTNLSLYYRLRAIAHFLQTGDTTSYISDLHRSGQTRLYYLKGSSTSERFHRTSRNRAFFDCIAINDLNTAELLAEYCDERWVANLEYEDDFLFIQFLQTRFLALHGRRTPRDCDLVLNRLSHVVAATDNPYLNLCHALQERNSNNTQNALHQIITRRAANYSRAAELGDLHSVFLHTERFIDIQAIAIVRIAADLGMQTRTWNFPRVPSELIELASSRNSYPGLTSWRRGA
ncbi:immunity 49 family protein [Corallococcus sp. M34]|uniref:immunity 49 family protein n=1 Tax=Citreicoccus inhibens TaxID=2849499 RepID=UPI001C21343F|nr:immunity 49 family protein [Citreicoccus inhibens]MBU8897878.1 immunity 49 family protein [Citreicoccus inhibens]